jgi:REP element-mobilizing transposase RayT
MFCTKDRTPAIAAAWRERLHAYPGGAVRNVNGVPKAIGGIADHVHLLIGLRASACLADVVRDVKAVSSRWVHEEIGERSFAWQYEHHRKRTFQEEYG